MGPMSSCDITGLTHVLMEVTNESYSGDKSLSKVEMRSESAIGLTTTGRLFTINLTDWIYYDIEEVSILKVCS